ncbi:restriction endonuclease subunit S [Streptomyces sudanensis]|uniref:restriction endonuclease subunit S n=1 Tax=Streptomyces sudanensis TaxID=436397 RepID=UPI0020CFA7C5|nr:restriction endonuclease subunit S [Streptomyces sudanensis]MCP9987018.1 restriction endonuclease subunit S [Streptomyces sudanensis]
MSEGGVSSELPEGWAWATLGEIADSVRNGIFVSRPGIEPDGVPILRIGAVRPLRLDLSDLRYSGQSVEELHAADRLVLPGDLLFTRYNGNPELVGACTSVPDTAPPLTYPDKLIRVRVDRRIVLPEFVAYAFSWEGIRAQVRKCVKTTAGQAGISGGELKGINLPVPSLEEQRRIVAALEERLAQLTRGVELLQASLRKLSAYGERLLLEACNGKLLGLLPAAEQSAPSTADCIDGELSALPEGWTWSRLGEFAEVVGGITKDAKKQSDPELPEVPYLRVANVQRGRLDLSNIATIRAAPSKVSALTLQSGDVLLNEGGDRDKLGRGWIWEGQIEGCIHQNHVFRARIHGGILNSKILAWHANSFGRHWFEVNGKQSVNLASISLRKIKQFPVPIPPQAHQERIVQEVERQLSVIESAEKIVRAALGRATSLRRSLLAEAFAGRLVPQDPADEPAAVLLDCIRAEREAAGVATSKRRSPRRAPAQRRNAPAADAPPLPRADGPALATATQPTLDLEMPS